MSNNPKPFQPQRSNPSTDAGQDDRSIEERPNKASGIPLRNKLILVVVTVLGLVLVGLLLIYLNGGNLNILADRADYVSRDPGQAASNLIEHGNVKGQSGQICGVVRSQYNSIISGAKVQIAGGQINWSTQADEAGQFCIPPLNQEALTILGEVLVGDYIIKASAGGYNPESQSVTIGSGEKKNIEFSLSLSKDKMLPSL